MSSFSESEDSVAVEKYGGEKLEEYRKNKVATLQLKKLERDRTELIEQARSILLKKYKDLVLENLASEKLDFEDSFIRIMKNTNKLYDYINRKP